MKTKAIFFVVALSASTCLLTAQHGNPPGDERRPPPREGGADRRGDAPGPAETLTDAQKAQVKAILSKFDANALTAETAKAIHEAFRQAGFRGGPAMGNANYSISTSLTGDSGEAFLAALTSTQRQLVTGLVDQQRSDLDEIVKTRRAIATELRRFMNEASVDKDKVMTLSKRYGELDGEISYFYVTAFAQAAETLTAEQKATLLKLRNLDAKFTCKGAYLYSRAIPMPEVPNSDFLFASQH